MKNPHTLCLYYLNLSQPIPTTTLREITMPDKTKELEKKIATLEKTVSALQSQAKAFEQKIKVLADNALDENYFPVLWRDDGYRTPGIDRFLNP